jgi:hypothetical protein
LDTHRLSKEWPKENGRPRFYRGTQDPWQQQKLAIVARQDLMAEFVDTHHLSKSNQKKMGVQGFLR